MNRQLTVKMLQLLANVPLKECPYCGGAFELREVQEHLDGKVGVYDCARCRAWMAVPFE
jgi:hypothetical protein